LEKTKNILICPLEWGLGHATRMIPVAAELLKQNHNVILASGEEHLSLLRNELPGCSFLCFPGFKPEYSHHLPQYVSVLLKIPLLACHVILEHFRLKKIIQLYSIDIVISDNRFGLWNRCIKSVYVTHMPLIPFPRKMKFLEPLGVFIHRQIIRKYDLCFIPDLPGDKNLSGRLSHGISLPRNVRYIGILSRFTTLEDENPQTPQGGLNNVLKVPPSPSRSRFGEARSGVPIAPDSYRDGIGVDFRYNTIILSGPEPQKEILKQNLIRLFKDKEIVTLIFEGKPEKPEETGRTGNIILYGHLSSNRMKSILSGSEGIISRSGYTTVMDLVSLNCRALLIPTPGQTEQEYLAEYMSEKGYFSAVRQTDIKSGIEFPGKTPFNSHDMMEESRMLLSLALKEMSEEPH